MFISVASNKESSLYYSKKSNNFLTINKKMIGFKSNATNALANDFVQDFLVPVLEEKPSLTVVSNTLTHTKQAVLDVFRSITKKDIKAGEINSHIHSNYSDGELPIEKIINQAIAKKKKLISIADHNTIDNIEEIDKYREHAKKHGLNIINAVELTAYHGKTRLHLLIYGADANDNALKHACNLAKSGHRLDVHSVIKDFSKKYVTVFAHPALTMTTKIKSLIIKLKNSGLDGVEVYYPYRKTRKLFNLAKKSYKNFIYPQVAALRNLLVNPNRIATKLNLVKTAGTDTHFANIDHP